MPHRFLFLGWCPLLLGHITHHQEAGADKALSWQFDTYCKRRVPRPCATLHWIGASCCRDIFFLDHNALTSCLCSRLLFERSVFGEDALVNVSVEKKDDNDGKLAGYIRIRSKTQGIALSLGDRITSVQRGLPENNAAAKPQ